MTSTHSTTTTNPAAKITPASVSRTPDRGYTLEVDHVTKCYGKHVVVDDLTFTVPPGRVTGFLGPNGSGKSTTMKIMLGLAAANHGRATIGGERYRDLPDPGRQHSRTSRAGSAPRCRGHSLRYSSSSPRTRVRVSHGGPDLSRVASATSCRARPVHRGWDRWCILSLIGAGLTVGAVAVSLPITDFDFLVSVGNVEP